MIYSWIVAIFFNGGRYATCSKDSFPALQTGTSSRREALERGLLVLFLIKPAAGSAAPEAEILAVAVLFDELPALSQKILKLRRIETGEDALVRASSKKTSTSNCPFFTA